MDRPVPADLQGRCAIVTGGSQGLGYAIAHAFLTAGASVLICARTAPDLGAAVDRLARVAGDQGILSMPADVGVDVDCDRLIAFAEERFGRVDILVNNAGILGPIGRVEDIPWDRWREAIAVNLVGPAYLSRRVVPLMKRTGGKIIYLSGGAATSPDPNFTAYAASKGGLVAFAASLAAEVSEFGIDVNTIAPGGLVTRLLDERLDAGRDRVGSAVYDRLIERKGSGGDSVSRAAALAVFLASPRSNGITGRLLSASWDDWASLPDRIDAIRDSDIFTLRRILPADRGCKW